MRSQSKCSSLESELEDHRARRKQALGALGAGKSGAGDDAFTMISTHLFALLEAFAAR